MKTRKGFRLGLWSLILGLLAPAWAISAFYLGNLSGSGHDFPDQASSFPEWATVPVYVLVLTAFFVVPVAIIAALVFGIIALRRNIAAGVVLAVVGLLLAVLFVVALVLAGLVFSGVISF